MNYELLCLLIILLVSSVGMLLFDVAAAGVLWLVFKCSFRRCFLWGLWLLILPPLLFLYGRWIERNGFQVKSVEVSSAFLPASFEGYRVVQISDLHLLSFQGRERALRSMVEKINSLNADIICFTGDLVTLSPKELEGFTEILSSLHARDGVFSVMGNHDYMMYVGKNEGLRNVSKDIVCLQQAERAMGWHLLLDEHYMLYRGSDSIAVVGVENISASKHFPSKGNLSAALAGTEGCYRLLLSHDPTHWDKEVVGKTDIPLTLSGHTHAMQLSLLGWCPSKYVYPHYKGLYTHNGQSLYVNIGLGETLIPARIGARPEITLLTLNR